MCSYSKHRVLPVFSRNRLTSSPLDATLTRMLISVDFKWFTGRLTRLESALTKNTRWVGPLIGPCVPLRASLPLWQSPGVTEQGGTGHAVCPIRPIAEQVLWCNNRQRYEISLRSGETTPLPPVSKSMRADIGDRSRFGPLCKSCLGSAGWLASSRRVGKAGSVRLG